MIQTLSATTTNFIYQYQDNFKDGLRRAQKLMETCEHDFAQLRAWFGITDGFGSSNRVTVQVETESLARNYGYKKDGSSFIRVNPFDQFSDADLADDAVRGLFVAEMIEILMDYHNIKTGTTTWRASYSSGEGLSRVAAALLHPQGYYAANLLNGPFVNTWLNGSRTDWITKNDLTDATEDSYAGAILFIYYLKDQLRFSMQQIVSKAGDTLEKTYQNLTGKTDGLSAFQTLLSRFFPSDKTAPSLKTDNPFPLHDGQDRTVFLSFTQTGTLGTIAREGTAEIRPFFTCPAKRYRWQIRNESVTRRCVATVTGFGQPVFKWKVNGQAIKDAQGTLSFSTTVETDDPQHPNARQSSVEQVLAFYKNTGNTSTWNASTGELDLSNDDNKGHEQLLIEVEVSEKYASTDTVGQNSSTMLDTQFLWYEPAYYDDRAACVVHFEDVLRRYVTVNKIPLILTLPDPAPEVINSIRLLKEVIAELETIRQTDAHLAHEIERALNTHLQVPHEWLSGQIARQ